MQNDKLPGKPNRWEGTQMYQRTTPKRTARTVAQIREEAAKKQKEDREARKEEAEHKRRVTAGARESATEPAQDTTQTCPSNIPVEEEMPGSNKKKRSSIPINTSNPPLPPPEQPDIPSGPVPGHGQNVVSGPPETPTSNPTGEGIDANLRNFLLSIKDELKKTTEETVEKFDKRMEKAEANIAELTTRVDQGARDIEGKIQKCVREEVAKVVKVAGAAQPPITSTRREESYHRSRRSIKMWPISGESLEDAVKVFLSTRLKFEDQRILMMGKLVVSRAKTRAAAERSEVVVVFEDKDDRDAVKAAGFNLANQKEAGMAIHVPGHLLDDFYALSSVGYSIKSNNEGTVKRAIKFDDSCLGLYLDICVNDNWKRVTPKEAKAVLKRIPTSVAASGRNVTVDELAGLVQGSSSNSSTAVVVLDDDDE